MIKVNFKELDKRHKNPILAHCRKLLAEGALEDERVEFYRNPEYPDVIVNNLGKASLLAVAETLHHGPVFVKHRKMDPDVRKQINGKFEGVRK